MLVGAEKQPCDCGRGLTCQEGRGTQERALDGIHTPLPPAHLTRRACCTIPRDSGMTSGQAEGERGGSRNGGDAPAPPAQPLLQPDLPAAAAAAPPPRSKSLAATWPQGGLKLEATKHSGGERWQEQPAGAGQPPAVLHGWSLAAAGVPVRCSAARHAPLIANSNLELINCFGMHAAECAQLRQAGQRSRSRWPSPANPSRVSPPSLLVQQQQGLTWAAQFSRCMPHSATCGAWFRRPGSSSSRAAAASPCRPKTLLPCTREGPAAAAAPVFSLWTGGVMLSGLHVAYGCHCCCCMLLLYAANALLPLASHVAASCCSPAALLAPVIP